MSEAWISSLADELKETGREAAESYGRELHRAGIIETEGKIFFTAVVTRLEQDLAELRSRLQGSPVACETTVQRDGPAHVKLTRQRFPWFHATLQHNGPEIVLEYARGRGVPAAAEIEERKTVHYTFRVDRLDRLAITEAFGDARQEFDQPDTFAKHLILLLFQATKQA